MQPDRPVRPSLEYGHDRDLLTLRVLAMIIPLEGVVRREDVLASKGGERQRRYRLLRAASNGPREQTNAADLRLCAGWETELIERGTSACVFIDLLSTKPLVIETKCGRLWTRNYDTPRA